MTTIVAVYSDDYETPISIHICDHCMVRDGSLLIVRRGIGASGDVFTRVSDYDYYKVAPYDDKGFTRLFMELNLELEYFNKENHRLTM